MKTLFKFSFFLLLLTSFSLVSQEENYTAYTIEKALTENANAVVRNNTIEITIEDFDKMVVKKREIVTVLNKLGNVDARIAEGYDNDTKIVHLSAVIYNAFGKEIKKFKKRDFLDVSAVDGGTLYSDSRVKYVEYTPTNYPYTLVFESEYKTSTTGFIPWWQPINGYYVSVEKSSYAIKNPKNIPWRIKKTNFNNFNIEEQETETDISFSMEKQPGYKYENAAVHYREILPRAIISLNKFSLKGVEGNYSNWKEFGAWMNSKLLLGRDLLPPATVSKIKNLVEGVKDPIERAKLVYKYMQDKTRYISVQVGIGGWEPIAAADVDKVGYGDCKGLTNYTKALLDVADVKSYYTVVYANEKRDIDKDFSSIQGNHVILNLPNNGNDVWLECTSQTMPFGFLGDFTDDRNVLVVTPEGGIIKKTTSYKSDNNLQETTAKINLQKDGSLSASLEITSKGLQYDDKQGIINYSEEELTKYYKTNLWDYNNNLEIVNTTLVNDKDNIVFKEKVTAKIGKYASINDKEYLFRVNIFNRNNYVPKRYRNRKLPLKIARGYKDVDLYKINLPKGYVLGVLPLEKELITKFGTYKIAFSKLDETSFNYKKELYIKEGVYKKEDYKAYRSFRRTVAKYENLRIAIIKKEL